MSDKALDKLEDEIANQLIGGGKMLRMNHASGPAVGTAWVLAVECELQRVIQAIRHCEHIMVTEIETADGEMWDARWLPIWQVSSGEGESENLPVAMVVNRWPRTEEDDDNFSFSCVIDMPWTMIRGDIATLDETAMDWAYELVDTISAAASGAEAVH